MQNFSEDEGFGESDTFEEYDESPPLMSPTRAQMLQGEPADGANDTLYDAGPPDPFNAGPIKHMPPGRSVAGNSARIVTNTSSGNALLMPTLEFTPPRKVHPRG